MESMPRPPIPTDEDERLRALQAYNVLDTAPERTYDDLTRLAAYITGAPTSLISLIDRDRQWFKARTGLEIEETTRDVSFCAYTLEQPDEILVVEDALKDPRFADNPLVVTDPEIRFYAGKPLVTPEGHVLGTLCVLDHEPKQLSDKARWALEALGRQAMTTLDQRRRIHELERRLGVDPAGAPATA